MLLPRLLLTWHTSRSSVLAACVNRCENNSLLLWLLSRSRNSAAPQARRHPPESSCSTKLLNLKLTYIPIRTNLLYYLRVSVADRRGMLTKKISESISCTRRALRQCPRRRPERFSDPAFQKMPTACKKLSKAKFSQPIKTRG